jgi:hypothetical protein
MAEPFWIAFGDIHEDLHCLSGIPDMEQAEGVLVSGDMTNVGDRAAAARILDAIRARNPQIWALIGNMDTPAVEQVLKERGVYVHGRTVNLGRGVGLYGVGYSTPTPFNTPSEVDEDQVREWLEQSRASLSRFEQTILMVHTPPFETATDRVGKGVPVGSRAVREFIESFRPTLCITGHIHESRGVDIVGETTVINPGNFGAGGYVRIALENGRLVAELLQA